MIVTFTKDANADLREIAEWIGRDDWDRAERFVDILRDKCRSLSHHPRRYPLVAGARQADLRKIAPRDHLIFYRLLDREVEIVRIVHGARDWASLIEPRAPEGG